MQNNIQGLIIPSSLAFKHDKSKKQHLDVIYCLSSYENMRSLLSAASLQISILYIEFQQVGWVNLKSQIVN